MEYADLIIKIVTIIVAVWGAVLSTVIYLTNKKRNKPNAMVKYGVLAHLPDNDDFLRISLLNVGDKDIYIHKIQLFNRKYGYYPIDRKYMLKDYVFTTNHDIVFPFKVNSGNKFETSLDLNVLKSKSNEWSFDFTKGFFVIFYDGNDVEYTSEMIIIK
jgi:hypothetical protein